MNINTITLTDRVGCVRGALAARSTRHSAALAIFLLLPPSLLLITTPCASAGQGWYPVGGLHWSTPLRSAVSDLYGSGPGLNAAMGYNLKNSLRIELRLDWYRQFAHPDPLLADQAESRLTLTPFSLESHYRLLNGGVVPYLLVGPSLVFSEERFRYTLLGRKREAIGRRTDFGAVIGAGLELRADHIRGRITLRALIASGDRQVLRSNGRTDPRSMTASTSLWTIGFELQPW